MAGFSDLPPGLYQVATPDEIEIQETTVILREDEHFWKDKKSHKDANDKWVEEVVGLNTNTSGLLIQAEAIGARSIPRIAQQDRYYCRAEAQGYRIHPDGFLEVYLSNKEYDLVAEMMKAALKLMPRGSQQQATPTTTALLKPQTEETALALVGTLPAGQQVQVMQARMEVQGHRLGLCETKAANRVLRHFVAAAGGVLKAKPGVGEVKIILRKAILKRRLDPDAVKAATENLYGPPARVVQGVVVGRQEEPAEEDAHIVAEERTDAAEADAPAEDAADTPPPDQGWDPGAETPAEPEPAPAPAPAPAPTPEPAPATVPMETYVRLETFVGALKEVGIEFSLPAHADLTPNAFANLLEGAKTAFRSLGTIRAGAANKIFMGRCKELSISHIFPGQKKAAEGGAA
jgi:hypothetical protein